RERRGRAQRDTAVRLRREFVLASGKAARPRLRFADRVCRLVDRARGAPSALQAICRREGAAPRPLVARVSLTRGPRIFSVFFSTFVQEISMQTATATKDGPVTPVANPSARYARTIKVSKHVRWDIDRDVIRGRNYNYERTFLPSGLSKVDDLAFLTAAEK